MAWVVDPTNKVIVKLSDFNGVESTTEYWVDAGQTDPESGAPAALAAAVQDISASLVTGVEVRIGATQSSPGAPSDGPYSRGSDKILLTLGGSDGSRTKMAIGAPLASTLNPDHKTVKASATNIDALMVALATHGKTAEGANLTGTMPRGIRMRFSNRKQQ